MFNLNEHNPSDDGFGKEPQPQRIDCYTAKLNPVFRAIHDAAIAIAHKNGHPVNTDDSTLITWDGVQRGLGRYAFDMFCPVCGSALSVDTGRIGLYMTGGIIVDTCNTKHSQNIVWFAEHESRFTAEQLYHVFADVTDRTPTTWINSMMDLMTWDYCTVRIEDYDAVLVEHGFDPDVDLCEIDDDPDIDFNTECLFEYPDYIEIDKVFADKFGMGDTVAVVRWHNEYTGISHEWLDAEDYEKFKERRD